METTSWNGIVMLGLCSLLKESTIPREQPFTWLCQFLLREQANPLTTHQAWVKAQKEIARLMLMTMDPEIQKTLKHLGAYDMLNELKTFYIGSLERLGLAMTRNLSVSLILVSLRNEYNGFVQNYNMHRMRKTVNELHAMLKLHEQTLPPKEVAPALHAIRAGSEDVLCTCGGATFCSQT
ncbi:hypothetical protein Tco_0649916 [Tanacetum coccineum]